MLFMDPGSEIQDPRSGIRDPGSGMDKISGSGMDKISGSGINIPDHQNCHVGSFEVSEQSALVPYKKSTI
jgi:hypothetical protein